jgi:hypothetical protein
LQWPLTVDWTSSMGCELSSLIACQWIEVTKVIDIKIDKTVHGLFSNLIIFDTASEVL